MIWEIPLKIPAESGTFGEGFTSVNSKMRKTRCCDKTIIYLKIKLKKDFGELFWLWEVVVLCFKWLWNKRSRVYLVT